MSLTLPQRPAQYFIDEVLLPSWEPTEAVGFDPSAAPGTEAFLPVATTLDTVGASYPSLVVQFSSENSGGESTYDYLTPDGPGQNRLGTLLITARAESERSYTGDSSTFAARDRVPNPRLTARPGGARRHRRLAARPASEHPGRLFVAPVAVEFRGATGGATAFLRPYR